MNIHMNQVTSETQQKEKILCIKEQKQENSVQQQLISQKQVEDQPAIINSMVWSDMEDQKLIKQQALNLYNNKLQKINCAYRNKLAMLNKKKYLSNKIQITMINYHPTMKYQIQNINKTNQQLIKEQMFQKILIEEQWKQETLKIIDKFERFKSIQAINKFKSFKSFQLFELQNEMSEKKLNERQELESSYYQKLDQMKNRIKDQELVLEKLQTMSETLKKKIAVNQSQKLSHLMSMLLQCAIKREEDFINRQLTLQSQN